MTQPRFRALGLMSGTAMDAIDAAIIETDGHDYVRPIAAWSHPYEDDFRKRLRACLGNRDGAADLNVALVERELTDLHAIEVRSFLEDQKWEPDGIDVIGFHGQTIWHHPEQGLTIQLGDGDYLARETGIPVVDDFRSADIRAGGQGAPLVPLYHRALAAKLPKPLAIVNIGGVSNITFIGGDKEEDLLAFDAGPGNALLDDWMLHYAGRPYDKDGMLAATGRVDEARVAQFLQHDFFARKPPKSLDRDAFRSFVPEGLSAAAGAATLTMMTSRAIAKGIKDLPQPPLSLYLTGGGRRNLTLRRWLDESLGVFVRSVDELGWNGDSLEAEAFAYLAVRSKLGLPLTLPRTTGVSIPTTGGVYHDVEGRRYPAIAS